MKALPAMKMQKKTAMKANEKKQRKAMKATVPETHKDRGKNRFCKMNKHTLPGRIQQLLDKSGTHEQGRLINKLVVKHSDGTWGFNLEDAYVQESMRALIARCSRCQHVVVFVATGT